MSARAACPRVTRMGLPMDSAVSALARLMRQAARRRPVLGQTNPPRRKLAAFDFRVTGPSLVTPSNVVDAHLHYVHQVLPRIPQRIDLSAGRVVPAHRHFPNAHA